jgi:MFS family permease
VAEAFGLRAPFVLLAFLEATACLWAVCQVSEPSTRPRPLDATAVAASGPVRRPSARGVLADPTFLVASLFGAALFIVRAGERQGVLPLYLGSFGYGPGDIGMLFTIGVLAQFLVVAAFGGVSDRFGRKAVIVPGAATMAAGAVIFIVGHSYPVFVLAIVLQQIGEGVAMPAPGAMVADLSRRLAGPGAALGVFRTISVGPVAVGLIADWAGYRWGIGFAALVILGAALIVAAVAREPRWDTGRAPA